MLSGLGRELATALPPLSIPHVRSKGSMLHYSRVGHAGHTPAGVQGTDDHVSLRGNRDDFGDITSRVCDLVISFTRLNSQFNVYFYSTFDQDAKAQETIRTVMMKTINLEC